MMSAEELPIQAVSVPCRGACGKRVIAYKTNDHGVEEVSVPCRGACGKRQERTIDSAKTNDVSVPCRGACGKSSRIAEPKHNIQEGFRPLSGSLWEKTTLIPSSISLILACFRPLSGSLWEKPW